MEWFSHSGAGEDSVVGVGSEEECTVSTASAEAAAIHIQNPHAPHSQAWHKVVHNTMSNSLPFWMRIRIIVMMMMILKTMSFVSSTNYGLLHFA